MPAYPNGRCYCGCGTELSDRTSFWARGHDRAALQRVIREHYSTVADFVVAHDRIRDDLAHLGRLLWPHDEDDIPAGGQPWTSEQWDEMRRHSAALDDDLNARPWGRALSTLQLARSFLEPHDRLTAQATPAAGSANAAAWGPFQRRAGAEALHQEAEPGSAE